MTTQKKYLVVNTGSASKKYGFYLNEQKVYSAHFEKEKEVFVVTEVFAENSRKREISQEEYINAIALISKSLIEMAIIDDKNDITLVGVRIVAPGEYFLTNRVIDEEYLKMAELAIEKVPLHLGPALTEIKNIKKFLGNQVKLVGVSDSAFHATINESAKFYAIPIKDSRELSLQRFGYHGISVKSVVFKAAETLGYLPEKIIVCHLGGGASVTAVKNGESIDTSMGFTPLEGLVMATRVGDIDAGAVLYLAEKLKKDFKELEYYFNNECGLLGLSGKSCDIRDLLEYEKQGDADSTLALEIYVKRIREYIGRQAVVLGGIDLLILAGTVSERSIIIRQRICENLEFLGLELDRDINESASGVEMSLAKKDAKTKILVVKTDEMEEIAKITYQL